MTVKTEGLVMRPQELSMLMALAFRKKANDVRPMPFGSRATASETPLFESMICASLVSVRFLGLRTRASKTLKVPEWLSVA